MTREEKQQRNRSMRRRFERGESVVELAASFRLTDRQVYRIVSPGDRGPGRPKLPLPAELVSHYRAVVRSCGAHEARRIYGL